MKKFFTSESVTEGHPDKVCDQISDAILDEILKKDPDARCAVECCAAFDRIMLMGEVTANADVDYEAIARGIIKKIGYTDPESTFSYDTCKIINAIHGQSPDIAQGVNGVDYDDIGAGDQGMMFGYACSETENLMPLPITLAHEIAHRLASARRHGDIPYLRPDGKTQVTVEYDGKRAARIDTVVLSTQHAEGIPQERIHEDMKKLILSEIPSNMLDDRTKYFINPTGNFVIGGPEGDSGLTGRKIIVDTYGGRCPHGGGAFSGKDATKVDRSAAYMARYICKNLVAAGICTEIELQVAYAIGVARPVSVYVDTFGTGRLHDDTIADIICREFDLRPGAIIDTLGLKRPIFLQTAVYGHFGKPDLPWEQTDRAEGLRKYLP
ncbi:MAG: methionine adenosyltransferase [Clostridia bacterium]|nr:methionine adenosyltransferase [Clostridia bacterium]